MSTNAEMIRYWNEGAGPRWVALQERLDAQIGPLGAAMVARADVVAGQRVIDVGCGCGGTTLELAERVGPAGRVLAIDVSAPMLAHARVRAEAAGLADRIEWRLADAQTAALDEAGFDRVCSRFGVMFFEDPVAAFANLARALRFGGRLAFVCWQARERNPWLTAPARAAQPWLELPPPSPPDAPGPFAFADAERVRDILARAGFGAIELESVEGPLRLGGGDLEQALEVALTIGPLGAALRDADPGPAVRTRVIAAVREALEAFRTPRGIEAPSAAWIVTATRA